MLLGDASYFNRKNVEELTEDNPGVLLTVSKGLRIRKAQRNARLSHTIDPRFC